MGSESNGGQRKAKSSGAPSHLEKFTLFQTPTNFYMIGRDTEKIHWRVLKINRSEPSELVIHEDPVTYSFNECKLLLQEISEANEATGGLKFVTNCYGIVGFIRFLGPYYVILITERERIGQLCGHPIYSISDYKVIPIPHTVWSCNYNSAKEKRYRKLLRLVEITKDFFYSYSYPIMHTLQQNLCRPETRQSSDGTKFIWNEYLTRQMKACPGHSHWTVALLHGFFKQVKLPDSGSGKTFILTLIARRSCQFAGTRYQKRGVDENGQAANDVEIEQIVHQEIDGECLRKITSIVQNRGSIPLCWSQKPSWLNLRPDVLLSTCNSTCQATRLHFESLRLRYGDPIIVLNLVKKCEKKQRESLLSRAFRGAILSIHEDWPEKDQLEFLSLDLDAAFRTESTEVLAVLKDFAAIALQKTGFFSCEIPPSLKFEEPFDFHPRSNSSCNYSQNTQSSGLIDNGKHQKGILRANCLDSLDRTNVAQYVYSYVALGHQLDALGITGSEELDFNHTLAFELMTIYEAMGDALAQQYGGSAAHSKIFSKTRGSCKVLTEFCEIVKTMQRHYSNSFVDADKQKAIDIFLGHLQPTVGSAPLRSNLEDEFNFEGVSAIFLKNKSRIIPYISSGRLLIDLEGQWFGRGRNCFKEDADKFDPQCQTG